ncbi:MAG: hypothetical protein WD065_03870 [Planctomycetaceae bacterium]
MHRRVIHFRFPSRWLSQFMMPLVILFALGSSASAALVFDVNVMVQGYVGAQKIGSITANSGPAADTDHLTANFEFANPFKGSILDGWYDFQWINVVTAATGGASALFSKYPNIDPQAPPKNGAEDNEPYYYNQATEWDPGMFGTEDIRDEGLRSKFSDSPQRALGDGFTFNTFLVAQDLTAGDFIGNKFSVLAGFNWTYAGGTAGTAGEDTSTVGAQIAINDTVITDVNTALQNEENDTFDTWTALGPQTLKPCVPEPIAFVQLLSLASCGLGVVIVRRHRSTRQAA